MPLCNTEIQTNLEFDSYKAPSSYMKTTCSTPPPFLLCTGMWLSWELVTHLSRPFHGHQASTMLQKATQRIRHVVFWRDGKVVVSLVSVSPRSLWSHTWMSAFLGFSSWASSGLPESAPVSPASACVLTDSAWRWPRGGAKRGTREVKEGTDEQFSLH